MPPCSWACCATNASPRPEPECDAVEPRENRSNTIWRSSSGSPLPLSSMAISTPARELTADSSPLGGAAVFDGVGDRVVDRESQAGGQSDDDAGRRRRQRHLEVGVDPHRVVRRAVEQFGDVDRHVVLGRRQLALGEPLQRGKCCLDA